MIDAAIGLHEVTRAVKDAAIYNPITTRGTGGLIAAVKFDTGV